MHRNLKELRIKNNLTSEMMAKKLNISKAFYSQIENNKRKLYYDMAIRIAAIFNLKPDDVFYEDYEQNI